MTPFTLVMAYYDNPLMLAQHVDAWSALPPRIRANLHVVIIDDGSPRWPAISAINWFDDFPVSKQLWAMQQDIAWGQDACRNRGVAAAPTEWVLMTDIDHMVPLTTWDSLMSRTPDPEHAYRFSRVSAPWMDFYKPHPNSWAMPRRVFERVGGYDEALIGNYGTDGDFLVRTQKFVEVRRLKAELVRVPREVIPDASTTTLERKNPEQGLRIKQLIAARRQFQFWRPKTLIQPCTRLL